MTAFDNSPHQQPDRTFAKSVEHLRERSGWSQSELARRMQDKGFDGFHQTTISRVEKGSRPVRIGEAIALADIFDRSLEGMYTPRPQSSDVDFYRAALDQLRDFRADAVHASVRFLWSLTDIEEFEVRYVTKPLSNEARALRDDYMDVLAWELDDLVNAVRQTRSELDGEDSLKLLNERLNDLWPKRTTPKAGGYMQFVRTGHDRKVSGGNA